MATAASSAIASCSNRCFSSSAGCRKNEAAQLRASSAFFGAELCHRPRIASRSRSRSRAVSVRAAKLPQGVDLPKEEPNLQVSFWGFTEKAEAWNSRAAMIGIFALVALEFIVGKGILQLVGVEVGKGLNLAF